MEHCKAIVKRLDNIHYSTNESELLVLADVWARKQEKRWGSVLNASTIYARDGLAIDIRQPTVKELRGRDIRLWRNRKGFWALIAQGFCDCNCRFAVFDIRWPGATNDIVAYKMTALYHSATNGEFAGWAAMVLDEAYSSCGGMHPTPFSISKMLDATCNDRGVYKMLSFIHILSCQRITIERAFGILVCRWGIL